MASITYYRFGIDFIRDIMNLLRAAWRGVCFLAYFVVLWAVLTDDGSRGFFWVVGVICFVALPFWASMKVQEKKDLSRKQDAAKAKSRPTLGNSGAALADKHQLFYWWLTDHFGDDEGKKVYRAALSAQRFQRAIDVHGDFIGARTSLYDVAMELPNPGAALALPPEVNTESTRKCLERMRQLYGS